MMDINYVNTCKQSSAGKSFMMKRSSYRRFLTASAAMILLTLILSAAPAFARQSFQRVGMYPAAAQTAATRTKICGKYFWFTWENSDSDGYRAILYCGGKTGAGTKLIDTYYNVLSPHKVYFLTDGETVYYLSCKTYDDDPVLCSISVTGKDQKRYGVFKNDPDLLMVSSSTLYYYSYNAGSLYAYNLKTKKQKRIWKNVPYIAHLCSNSGYVYGVSRNTRQAAVKVFDLKKRKITKTYMISAQKDKDLYEICASPKYLYLASSDQNGNTAVYRMPASGKTKPKKITSVKTDMQIFAADDQYFYYETSVNDKSRYYKYNVTGRKAVKITEKAYYKACGY